MKINFHQISREIAHIKLEKMSINSILASHQFNVSFKPIRTLPTHFAFSPPNQAEKNANKWQNEASN